MSGDNRYTTGSSGHICSHLVNLDYGLSVLNAYMWIVKRGDSWLLLTRIGDKMGKFEIPLNFCPFCGDKLVEDDENDEESG